MATTFTSELDGANGVVLTASTTDGGNSGFDAKTGDWLYSTGVKASGTASATLTLAAATGLLTRVHPGGPVSVRYYDHCFRLNTLDGGNVEFVLIRLGSGKTASLILNAAGQIQLRNGNFTVATTATAIEPGEFFRVQWGIDGDTQTVRLWKNATLANLFTGAPTETKSGAYSGGPWDSFRVGCNTAHTLQLWVDRVIIDNATWPGGGGGQAPTANAGADTSATGGQSISLNGGGTDPDGTITGWAWEHVSGPVGSFSSTTVEDPTWTAPQVPIPTDVVLGLRVTDDDGQQSTRNDVTIAVSPGAGTPAEDFFELFNAGPAGATVTTSNTDMDDMSAGITFLADSIGEGSFAVGGAGGAAQFLTHLLAAPASEEFADAVFKVDTLGAIYYLMSAHSGSTARAFARINADGSLQLRNGSTAVGAATTARVTAGQPFRIAWRILNGGTMEARLFTGSNLWGTTPDVGGTTTGAMNTGTFDRLRFGLTLSATVNWVLDSVRVDATTWPAPIAGAVVYHSNFWVAQADGSLLETPLVVA